MKRLTFGTIEEIRTKFGIDLLKLLEDEKVLDRFANYAESLPIMEYFFEEDFRNDPNCDFDFIKEKTMQFIQELSRFFPNDQRMLLALVFAKTEAIQEQFKEVEQSMNDLLLKASESISSGLPEHAE